MQNIDRLFVLTAIVFILAGMSLGLYMGMHQDFTLRPVHAHLNLLGFVVMMLFGFAYHMWPAMKEGVLPVIHYVLHLVGTAVSMALLHRVLSNPESGPALGLVIDAMAGLTMIGVLIFAYLFFTRANN